MGKAFRAFILGVSLVFTAPAPSRCESQDPSEPGLTRGEKALLLNAAGLAGLAYYGFSIWRYGERSTIHTNWEGGFDRDTKHGGVDKLGHAFTGYAIARTFSDAYLSWGYGARESAWMGFGSSMFFTTMMEIGDGFSAFGLAPEDLVANTCGASLGLLLNLKPKLAELIDYRVEYWPGGDRVPRDVMTDYRHMRFHLALKLSGFERFRKSWPGYLEFHLGYFATGPWHDVERHLFAGVGVNVSRLIESWRGHWFFNYYQLPGAYAAAEEKF